MLYNMAIPIVVSMSYYACRQSCHSQIDRQGNLPSIESRADALGSIKSHQITPKSKMETANDSLVVVVLTRWKILERATSDDGNLCVRNQFPPPPRHRHLLPPKQDTGNITTTYHRQHNKLINATKKRSVWGASNVPGASSMAWRLGRLRFYLEVIYLSLFTLKLST